MLFSLITQLVGLLSHGILIVFHVMRVERDNVVMAVLCGDDWFQTFFYSSLDHKAVAVVTTASP